MLLSGLTVSILKMLAVFSMHNSYYVNVYFQSDYI